MEEQHESEKSKATEKPAQPKKLPKAEKLPKAGKPSLVRNKSVRAEKLKLPPGHFLNRELAWVQFNRRVFAQAQDKSVPLLERLRFLCITASNLDEFFEVRVSGLKERINAKAIDIGIDGRPVEEIMDLINRETHALVGDQYELLGKELIPALEKEGIVFLHHDHWTPEQAAWVREHFNNSVLPVLTPIALDPAHPFPRLVNKSLSFIVELDGRDGFGRSLGLAIVQAPRALPRFIALPPALGRGPYTFVFLSSMIHANVGELFPGLTVKNFHQFRVTRNSELFVDEEEVKDLRKSLQGELTQRHFGDAVRLEISDDCPDVMVRFLLNQFHLQDEDLYRVHGLVNLVRLMPVPEQVERPQLLFAKFQPSLPKGLRKGNDIFMALRRRDILLHHPYESFAPIIELIGRAANDPQVLGIKITVYRTGTDSQLMESLLTAARLRKEVTVVLELMARFDEEANINWANRLEQAGAHVVYGVFGFKTHAKMLLIIRSEADGMRSYAHIGTGNYHPRTARLYTDFGLLTSSEEVCKDVHNVFQLLTGLSVAPQLTHLWQAPFNLHSNLLSAIAFETAQARKKKPAHIIAKMNAILEPQIIAALYKASQAGVKIELIVRGACILRPGIKGLSDNIRVVSAIGRFLEHSRVFHFHAAGKEHCYIASADWMERNFFRRVEVCCPILDRRLKKRIVKEALTPFLAPEARVWEMKSDGTYILRGNAAHHPQQVLMTKRQVEEPANSQTERKRRR